MTPSRRASPARSPNGVSSRAARWKPGSGGSWCGRRSIFAGARCALEDELDSQLVVSERDPELAEAIRRLPPRRRRAAPAFVDNAARQFTVELVIHNTLKNRQIDTKVVYLTCDRIESRCRRGRSLDPRRFRWSALVSNPSRPLPD